MANRQTVPGTGVVNNIQRTGVYSQPMPSGLQRVLNENTSFSLLRGAVDLTNKAVGVIDKLRQSNDEAANEEKNNVVLNNLNRQENLSLQEDALNALNTYNQAMQEAPTVDAIDEIGRVARQDLQDNFIKSRYNGKGDNSFWQKYGRGLLEAHDYDVERIKRDKAHEFGRQNLIGYLANIQNKLATFDNIDAKKVLADSAKEIRETPFLSQDEKQDFHQKFFMNGLLNLALRNPDVAEEALQEYLPDDVDEMKEKIATVRELSLKSVENDYEKREDDDYFNQFDRVQNFWQAREKGEISPAEFYVLTAYDNKDVLWGLDDEKHPFVLSQAYQLMKDGAQSLKATGKNMASLGNYIISAYRQNQLSFDDARFVLNNLSNMRVNGVDKEVLDLADKIYGGDVLALSHDIGERQYMDEKAKLALRVFRTYYDCKNALLTSQAEGNVTKMAGDDFSSRQKAIEATKNVLGFKENEGNVLDFSELKKTLAENYSGERADDIWKRFANEAVCESDKKAVLKKIAKEEQVRDLKLPRFDSYDEVYRADLQPGDKFYFKGRLAVYKG